MLIAVVGFAGAGKTTTVEYLQELGVGQVVYVGKYVRAEVLARGLPPTPENEQLVRDSMRKQSGRDALARTAVADLRDKIVSGAILLDAICVKEESDYYRDAFGSNVLIIGIQASFSVRAKRLSSRGLRPMTKDQLRTRDRFERDELRLHEVLKAADYHLSNEDNLDAFKQSLDKLAGQW